MRETTVIRPGETAGGGDRGYVDWAAILAGAAIAAGTSIVLTGFATGLGLGAISADPSEGISTTGLILTAIVTVVSMVAAYMLGGYISGRMRRRVDGAAKDEVTARDGIHGLVVWSLGMLVAGFMAMNIVSSGAKAVGSAAATAVEAAGSAIGGIAQGAGQLAGGAISGVGQAAGGVLQGVGEAAGPALSDMLPEGVKANPLDYAADTLLRPAQIQPGTTTNTAVLRREVTGIMTNLIRTGEVSDADVAYLKAAVASQTGLTQGEVDARVNEAVASVQQLRADAEKKLEEARAAAEQLKAEAAATAERVKQEAIEAAETARVSAVLTAFLLAASALLAAAAAYIGAVKGGRHRDEGRIWGGLGYHR